MKLVITTRWREANRGVSAIDEHCK